MLFGQDGNIFVDESGTVYITAESLYLMRLVDDRISCSYEDHPFSYSAVAGSNLYKVPVPALPGLHNLFHKAHANQWVMSQRLYPFRSRLWIRHELPACHFRQSQCMTAVTIS